MNDVLIVSAARSALGQTKTGLLAAARPDEILAAVLKEALVRVPQVDWYEIEDVLVGCAFQEGEQGCNIARQAVHLTGLPATVPAATVTRHCASSLSALVQGAALIRGGYADTILVGGVESFSRVPMGGYNPSPSPRLLETKPETLTPAGVAAENMAQKYNVSREEQDAYAAQSHRKALHAWTQGQFANEIVPIRTLDANGREILAARDDLPREVSEEDLARLSPGFMVGGTVTEGNSAPPADGASAILLMSGQRTRSMGINPLARLRSWAVVGCPAEIMSYGAVLATHKALERADVNLDQFVQIEFGEQFAASTLGCLKEIGLGSDPRVNPFGGAVALGHPMGAAGVRMVTTLVHGLKSRGGGLGLCTLGVVGGQGEALVIEA